MSDVLERATIQRAMEVSGRLTGSDDWRDIAVAIDDAVLAEREACAKIAEVEVNRVLSRVKENRRSDYLTGIEHGSMAVAEKIRARGGKS